MANKDNSGALFKEKEKKSEKHPDYKGNCLVNGEVMYIAAWINTPKAGGDKYMSLSFSPPPDSAKYNKETADATPKPEFAEPSATPVSQSSDDIPF